MPFFSKEYVEQLKVAIITYQLEHLLSDRELSLKAGLSPSMVSKIKSGKTIPKPATLRKLRGVGVVLPVPSSTG